MRLSTVIFTVLFLVLLFLLITIFRPLIGTILFAGIIGGAFYPIHQNLLTRFKIKKEFVALISCTIIVVIVFLPLIFIVFQLSSEVYDLYANYKNLINEESLKELLFGPGYIAQVIDKISSSLNIEFDYEIFKVKTAIYAKGFSGHLVKSVNGIISNLFAFFFNFFIMLLVIYTFFVEGERLKNFILKLSPMPDDQEELILKKFNQMNYVTLVCNGIGGFIQGSLAMIGFAIAGVNSIFLLGALMIILAFIPLVGISIIYIPACLILLIQGKAFAAITLFIYCTLVAFIVENWFKPKFIGNKIKINSLFVFFCIIGGMMAFDFAGIFYGPLIGILFLTAVDIYHDNYASKELS